MITLSGPLDAAEWEPPPFDEAELVDAEAFEISGGGSAGILWLRGARFVGDTTRYGWLVLRRNPYGLRRIVEGLRYTLRQHGVIALRWVLPWSEAERCHRAWLRLGARTVNVDWSAPERWVTFQFDDARTPPRVRTARGQELGAPLLSEWDILERWSRDPKVAEPLRLDGGLSQSELARHAYGSLSARAPTRARIWMVRREGQPVGVALDYVWHYSGDTIREIDTALPVGDPSPKILLDAIAGAMHLAYSSGASQTIGNVRQPFPRLFARVGGTDRTEDVLRFGKGVGDRYYYVASASEFYRSREGRQFTPFDRSA